MPITDAFRKEAEHYTGTLDQETVEAMKSKGYIFRLFESVNNGPERPWEAWEVLVEELGGEDALEADFDYGKDPAFTVKHIPSGKVKTGNGSVDVLAELWLELN